MIRFESLLNEQRCSAAVAEVTFAHASEFDGFSGVGRQSIRRPSSGAVGNPPLLTASWRNPNASGSSLVNYLQSPSSLEFNNVAVGDNARTKGINNYQVGFSQQKSGSKPQEKNCDCYCESEGDIKPVSRWVHDCLNQEQDGKKHSNRAPHKVTFRLENFTFTHSSIFTGISANGKGK